MGKREESESSFDVSSGSVEVSADVGDVSVRRGGSSVSVRMVKAGGVTSSLSAVSMSASRDGETVLVSSHVEERGFFTDVPQVDIDITMPESVSLASVDLEHGDVTVDGVAVESGATLRSKNGDVSAVDADGDVSLETKNGDVIAERVAGFVSCRSTNGDVSTTGCRGVEHVATVNGDADAAVAAVRESVSVESSQGDVSVTFGPDLDATVVAQTDYGEVDGVDAFDATESASETRVEGTVGDGGPELHAETAYGDVSLEAHN